MGILTTSNNNIYENNIFARTAINTDKIKSINGALALRPRIENVVDEICKLKYKNIYFMGIGGTYASSMQVVTYMEGKSELPVFYSNAAEYNTNGNKKIGKGTIIIFSSVSGTTYEMVKAIEKVKSKGCKVFAFIDKENTILGNMADWTIVYPMNEQLKFFMVANRLMYNNNEFPEYDDYNKNMEEHLANSLYEVEKAADSFGKAFAKEHCNDTMHYFVGAGVQWGATYSYAMCYWEEQLWIKTKSIHSSEFFHGMLEIVDKDVAVTLFICEDEQRDLGLRVANFLPRICGNYTIIDTNDYKEQLSNIKPEYRGSISHLVIRAITSRIDAYMEIECRHPMEIRRYYNSLKY